MGVVRVEGARLYFQTCGRGRPLLLLHGLGSSGRDWEYQVPALKRAHRLVIPDLRGHGASERAGAYTVHQFARDAWALVDQLGCDEVDVLGHSMGGAVAMQMALDRPGAIGKLVLSNTLPSFLTDTLVRRWQLWSRLLMMSWFGPRRLSEVMTRRLYPRPDQAALRAKVARRNARNDKNVYLETVRALTRWSIRDRIGELKLPVLVLAAEFDYFGQPETDEFVAGLPDGRLVKFPGTRHGLPLELPAEFNRAVLEFLASGSARAHPAATARPAALRS